MLHIHRLPLIFTICCMGLSACAPAAPLPTATPLPSATLTPTEIPPMPTETLTPVPTETPTPTETPAKTVDLDINGDGVTDYVGTIKERHNIEINEGEPARQDKIRTFVNSDFNYAGFDTQYGYLTVIDFYERLRVPFGTDGIALQAAIAALRKSDAPTAERAAGILLKPSRRKGCDRLWLALTRIGQARALGALNDAPFGSRQEYADFRFHAGEARPSDQGTYTGETEAGDSIPMWRTVLGKLLGLVPLLAFLAFFGWMATETSRPPLQQPSETYPPNALAERPSGVQPTAPALSIQPLPETGDGKTTVNAGDDNWIQISTT